MPTYVQYYGRQYDIERFNGRGWRWHVVRFLARFILRLQRAIEWHTMHLVAKQEQLSAETVRNLEDVFAREDAEERRLRTEGGVVTNLLRQDRYTMRQFSPEQPIETEPRPQPADPAPGSRPSPLTTGFAPYLAPGRSGKYARRRGSRLADPEGDVVSFWHPTRKQWQDGDAPRPPTPTRPTESGEPED